MFYEVTPDFNYYIQRHRGFPPISFGPQEYTDNIELRKQPTMNVLIPCVVLHEMKWSSYKVSSARVSRLQIRIVYVGHMHTWYVSIVNPQSSSASFNDVWMNWSVFTMSVLPHTQQRSHMDVHCNLADRSARCCKNKAIHAHARSLGADDRLMFGCCWCSGCGENWLFMNACTPERVVMLGKQNEYKTCVSYRCVRFTFYWRIDDASNIVKFLPFFFACG